MKKFFTLFAAALVMLSVNAAPVLQKLDRSQAHAIKAALPHKANAIKVQAPARVQDFTPVFNDCQAWGYDTYYGDGSWDLELYNGQDYVGTLAIMGDCDANHICGTYDLANAVEGYPGAYFVRAVGDTIDAVSGSFVITYVSTLNDVPTYHVSGSLVCNDASVVALDNDFEVSYAIDFLSYVYYYYGMGNIEFITLLDAPYEPTGDTIDVVIPGKTSIKYFSEDGDFYFVGYSDEVIFQMDLYVDAPLATGYYTLASGVFDTKYTGLYDATTQQPLSSLVDAEASIVVTADTTFYEVWLTLNDGNVYYVTGKNYAIVPTDTVNVNIVDATWNDAAFTEQGWWQAMGAESTDTLYYVSLSNIEATQIAGTYTIDDMDMEYTFIYDANYGDYPNVEDVTVTIAADATSPCGYAVSAVFICDNAVQYNVSFTFVNPSALPELIEKLNGETRKALVNGEVVVIRNGKAFNMKGARL